MKKSKFEIFSDQLMEPSGPSKTIEGEVIRAANKIIYRFYNDGDLFYKGYGIETCGSPHSYLVGHCPISHLLEPVLNSTIWEGEKIYGQKLDEIQTIIADWVESKNGNYTINSEGIDMYDFESMFEEDEDWYEEDDWYDDY